MIYFIVFRPLSPFSLQEISKIVRPIKRASHPHAIAVELHEKNSLGDHDPHLHMVLKTDDLQASISRFNHFLGRRWALTHSARCYSPLGAMLYAANKPEAEPVFYRGNLVELC